MVSNVAVLTSLLKMLSGQSLSLVVLGLHRNQRGMLEHTCVVATSLCACHLYGMQHILQAAHP